MTQDAIIPLDWLVASVKEDSIRLRDAVLAQCNSNHAEFFRWLLGRAFWTANWYPPYDCVLEYLYNIAPQWSSTGQVAEPLAKLIVESHLPWEEQARIRDEVQLWLRETLAAIVEEYSIVSGSVISEEKLESILRLLDQYSYSDHLEIPPWASDALSQYQEDQQRIAVIFARCHQLNLYPRGSKLKWVRSPTGKWEWVFGGGAVMLYYTHSKRLVGSEQIDEELAIIKANGGNCQVVHHTEEYWTRKGLTDGSDIMQYCLYQVTHETDILVFSEYEGFVGRGVFAEVERAQSLGIPVFLLRDGVFWLNPRLEVHDEGDWAVEYAAVGTCPHAPVPQIADWLIY